MQIRAEKKAKEDRRSKVKRKLFKKMRLESNGVRFLRFWLAIF
jgi:hypothetical protein